jgi:hypothetical protein
MKREKSVSRSTRVARNVEPLGGRDIVYQATIELIMKSLRNKGVKV